jgi:dipeptidyl aminopeptidase/acylaminoacyl peptidase
LLADLDRAAVQVSPDGKRIGWLGPVHGVANVWVAPADDAKKGEAVTHLAGLGARAWWWSYDSDRVLFAQDEGDDGQHLVAVDLSSRATRDLAPIVGVHAELVKLSAKRPREALVGLNDRDKKLHDLYLVDLATGARKLVARNDGGYAAWLADDDLRARYALLHDADASLEFVSLDRAKPSLHFPMEDALAVRGVDFDKDGRTLYLEDSRGRYTTALVAVDTKTGQTTVVAQDPHADVADVLVHPTRKTVEAVSFEADRSAWTVVDPSVQVEFDYLSSFGDGKLLVTSRSLDEQTWIVAYEHSDGPVHYYRYDRDPQVPGAVGKATFLFGSKDDLEHVSLAAMRPVTIPARDGLELVGYLTLPTAEDPRGEGRPKELLPTVLWVHGGPWERARWGFSPPQQWLANRGYAVVTVNFRGSTGLGKRLANAGNLEWGGRMEDDLLDAARWAVDQKISDPERIAIVGEGYGGYAALVALTRYPGAFACGVDVGGAPNLLGFVQNVPPYLVPQSEQLAKRIGDWRTEEGRGLLIDRSPTTRVAAVRRPLLVAQGKGDRRVTDEATEAFVQTLKARSVPVTYVVYPDEAQGLARAPDRIGFGAISEAFLARCLGGSYQPIGEDFVGSSFTVPLGPQYVEGLESRSSPSPHGSSTISPGGVPLPHPPQAAGR